MGGRTGAVHHDSCRESVAVCEIAVTAVVHCVGDDCRVELAVAANLQNGSRR